MNFRKVSLKEINDCRCTEPHHLFPTRHTTEEIDGAIRLYRLCISGSFSVKSFLPGRGSLLRGWDRGANRKFGSGWENLHVSKIITKRESKEYFESRVGLFSTCLCGMSMQSLHSYSKLTECFGKTTEKTCSLKMAVHLLLPLNQAKNTQRGL